MGRPLVGCTSWESRMGEEGGRSRGEGKAIFFRIFEKQMGKPNATTWIVVKLRYFGVVRVRAAACIPLTSMETIKRGDY